LFPNISKNICILIQRHARQRRMYSVQHQLRSYCLHRQGTYLRRIGDHCEVIRFCLCSRPVLDCAKIGLKST
jgi:hypothetical protein